MNTDTTETTEPYKFEDGVSWQYRIEDDGYWEVTSRRTGSVALIVGEDDGLRLRVCHRKGFGGSSPFVVIEAVTEDVSLALADALEAAAAAIRVEVARRRHPHPVQPSDEVMDEHSGVCHAPNYGRIQCPCDPPVTVALVCAACRTALYSASPELRRRLERAR